MLVVLAMVGGEEIGYCVSTIDGGGRGEIDSIFVDEEYRSRGVGDELMKQSLDWLGENNARESRLWACYGNEDVIDFYGKHGFYPRYTVLTRQ